MVRYADDFNHHRPLARAVGGESPTRDNDLSREAWSEPLKEKTKITHIEVKFDFLGANVRKYGRKLLIAVQGQRPRPATGGSRSDPNPEAATAPDLIKQLNKRLKGWANSQRHLPQSGLPVRRSMHLQSSMAMGKEKASREGKAGVKRGISARASPSLDLHRAYAEEGWTWGSRDLLRVSSVSTGMLKYGQKQRSSTAFWSTSASDG